MNKNQRFEELLESYLANTASADEWTALMQMIRSGEYDDTVKQKIDEVLAKHDDSLNISADRAQDLLYKILSAEKHTAKLLPLKRPVRKFWSVAAAAVIVLLLSVGGYVYFNKNDEKQTSKTDTPGFKNDVPPGGNKAILTLADGSQIILDSAANGTLTQQGNTKIIKLNSGQLAYNATSTNGEILYNTISTPKGGQYQIVLADGSKVWLNAASSLRFPTSFSKERNVQLTGEGYFEIAKNASMPFHVKVNDMTVEVLGTHFNVNAYSDEATVKTTLLEGSVKVINGNTNGILKPGQQSQVNKNGEIKVVNANVDEAVAWKNGMFKFNRTDLKDIMRQISRWYDVEVSYTPGISSQLYNGDVSRTANLSEVLKVLEYTGAKFKIQGKKITVEK